MGRFKNSQYLFLILFVANLRQHFFATILEQLATKRHKFDIVALVIKIVTSAQHHGKLMTLNQEIGLNLHHLVNTLKLVNLVCCIFKGILHFYNTEFTVD